MKHAALAILLFACSKTPTTELMVVVESDLSIPAELDTIRIDVLGPQGETRMSTGTLSSATNLPATVGLEYRSGALGPLSVQVLGQRQGTTVVQRQADVDFVRGEVRILRMRLDRACVGMTCPGQTCAAGVCRVVRVEASELEPYRENLASDAGAPIPTSDGATCPLDAICGHRMEHLPGDLITVGPCRTLGVATTSRVRFPSGLFSDETQVRLSEPGSYRATLSVPSIPGCEMTSSFDVARFEALPSTNRPAVGALRMLDARVGMAFVAARTGPFAVTSTGWIDLAGIATGTMPTVNLASVQVWQGEPTFGAQTNEVELSRITVNADATAAAIAPLTLPIGRRQARSMAVALGGDRNGDSSALIAATTDGVVAFESLSGMGRMIDPAIDATGLALGRDEPTERGAIWALTPSSIAHLALGGGARLGNGTPQALGVANATAIAVDDRDASTPRLYVCAMDGGVRVYDLSGDWSMRPDLGTPLAMQAAQCTSIDVDQDGVAWAGDAMGMLRVDRDLSGGIQLGATQGLPDGVMAVAAAWNDEMREIYAITTTGTCLVARAAR
jgi:hypothetical protein